MTEIKPYREELPTPYREITCQRCGVKFYVRGAGQGNTKHCIECRVILYEERTNKYDKKRRK